MPHADGVVSFLTAEACLGNACIADVFHLWQAQTKCFCSLCGGDAYAVATTRSGLSHYVTNALIGYAVSPNESRFGRALFTQFSCI